MKLMKDLNSGKSSIQAIAELIQGSITPAMADRGKKEIEDIMEEARNAYTDIMWQVYMSQFSQGDRQVLEGLLQRERYTFTDSKELINIENIQVVTLPRDAGVYMVKPFGKTLKDAKPYTKSTSGQANMTPSRINPGLRYYRINDEIYFPDGHPDAVEGVDVVFYGLGTNDEIIFIPRDFASKVRDKVWASLFPGVQIPADATNNANPNE